jgi:hypothetical protein
MRGATQIDGIFSTGRSPPIDDERKLNERVNVFDTLKEALSNGFVV